MRNKIRIIVCLMLVVCIAAFAVACQEKDADGLIKLSTPKNLALNGSALSWDEVTNAKEYFVSIKGEDGEEREQSVGNNTTCDLSLMVTGYGNFEIKVRAYGDGEKYGTSDKSSAITYRKGDALDTPIVTLEGKLASWGSIADAANYSVKVVNRAGATLDELTSEERSYSFDKENIFDAYDEYMLSVIANPASDDVKHSSSLAGRVSYYNSTVLEAPEFTSISGSYIYWKTVANAKSYTLRLTFEDDTFEESKDLSSTTTNYYFSNNFNFEKAGKYTFSIRANGDEVYKTSEYSVNNDEKYVINKLAPVEAENISMTYEDGLAKLRWKISADSLAKEFTLYLNPMKPNGKAGWADIPELKKTISNNLTPIKASAYDLYKYGEGGENGIVKQEGTTILVFRDEAGDAKVLYNTTEYNVKNKEDNNLTWEKYTHKSNKVDIIFDDTNSKFVYDEKEYHELGKLVNQDTEQEKVNVTGTNGRQRYYWDKVTGESDIKVVKGLEYESDNTTIAYHTFELALDDVFIKKVTENDATKYEYTINDDRYYGVFYNVAISAGNKDSSNYRVSQNTTLESQYMSYKIPEYKEDKYIVTNAGEYAYIILNAFKNEGNTDVFSIEKDINFNGYEVAQIENFKGAIDGNKHTVSGIVIGNKILTQSGVVENNNQETLQYSMFVNIDNSATIQNVFYVGMSFVGYDVEKLKEDVKAIQVAPIAIENKGTISDIVVQIDSIKAQSADVAGMVIFNYGTISASSVYATLEGRNVGGVMTNNMLNAQVTNVGFYGKINATVGKVLVEGQDIPHISGAGFAVTNIGIIENCFAIGNIDDKDKSFVTVTAEQIGGIFAGGFVASNDGSISNSYSGEFTLNNMTATVTANGDNAHAGGFVAYNTISGTIVSCYSTNEAAASVAGGFVGLNESSITSCYSTGGAKDADKNSENKGAFVGRNQGNAFVNCVSYSRDGKDKAVEGVTSTDDLEKIVNKLYGDEAADMGAMKDKGYRNPIIRDLIYTKDNTLTAIPGQTGENLKNSVLSRVAIFSDAESVDVEVILHGDNRETGNKIVIELKAEGFASRYIYGVIK